MSKTSLIAVLALVAVVTAEPYLEFGRYTAPEYTGYPYPYSYYYSSPGVAAASPYEATTVPRPIPGYPQYAAAYSKAYPAVPVPARSYFDEVSVPARSYFDGLSVPARSYFDGVPFGSIIYAPLNYNSAVAVEPLL